MNQTQKDLKRLYKRLDAIAAHNDEQEHESEEVKLLRQLGDQKELVDSLDKSTVAYRKAYNDLLILGYKYYKASGQLDPHSLPDVTADQLIQFYNRQHKTAFNLDLQTHVHQFLVEVTPILLQLENVPAVAATTAQFEQIRLSFQKVLTNILTYGFALDIAYYQEHIESDWLVIKMARQLSPNDFKPLVRDMDRYSRMRTGQEQNVKYVPDEAHRPLTKAEKEAKKTDAEKRQEEAKRRNQIKEQAKRASRLQIQKDANGNLIVNMPSASKK